MRKEGTDYVASFKLGRYDHSRPLVINPVVLAYCGYIGSSADDDAFGIAVDAAGNAYVTGSGADEATFPRRLADVVGGALRPGTRRALAQVGAAAVGTESRPKYQASIDQRFGRMQPYFVENRGQLDGRVGYYLQGQTAA